MAKFKLDRAVQSKKPAVIAAYKRTFSISEATEAAGVPRDTHYDWLKSDPAYKAAFEASKDEAIESLEDHAVKRAKAGSDVLTMFLLNGARPEKYKRVQQQQHTGPDGGPLAVTVNLRFTDSK
jgi:hypothetical protein